MIMKRKGLIVLIASLLCCIPAQAQLGNLINKGKKAVQKAKDVKEKVEKTKDKVDEEIKKANGDIDFYYMDANTGYYRSKSGKIVLEQRHNDGDRSGKNIYYTIEKNGDIKSDDGRTVGQMLSDGVINCQNCSPYVTLAASGDVLMEGEVIGNIDKAGNVTLLGERIGRAPDIDKQVAAYIYFGLLNNKPDIDTKRAKIEQERLLAEQARIKAAQEAEAKRKAMAANQPKTQQTSGKKSSSTQKKATSNTTKPKVQEWRIEKGSSRGYVDANGVVYNSSHQKIGQLPNGSGDIKDASGSTIGRISMGDIYDRSGKVCTVSSGGSISVPGSNATVAEVHAGGRIDMNKDSKTLGYCDVRPYEWAVAIIFCDIFRF